MKHAAVPGRHRAEVRPRYRRIAVLSASLTVVAISVLGGLGLMPSGESDPAAAVAGEGTDPAQLGVVGSRSDPPTDDDLAAGATTDLQTRAGVADRRSADRSADDERGIQEREGHDGPSVLSPEEALPAESGDGKRIVFSEARQRVWLVQADGTVKRTYLVSGSIYDNLDPGTYEVFSKSRHAVGIDDSGTMEYFVRFTYGDQGAAIGFHTIPVDEGVPVQTEEQLGTPLSHGCIRQRRGDAIRLWRFAPIGATVVVTP